MGIGKEPVPGRLIFEVYSWILDVDLETWPASYRPRQTPKVSPA